MHRFLVAGVAALLALALSAPAGAWTWPADGAVLRPFGLGSDPYAGGQHRGVDVAGPEGAAIRAPAAGTVTFAGSLSPGKRTSVESVSGHTRETRDHVDRGPVGGSGGDEILDRHHCLVEARRCGRARTDDDRHLSFDCPRAEARRELDCRATDDLFVKLRQLTADGDAPIRVRPREARERPREAPWRLEGHGGEVPRP